MFIWICPKMIHKINFYFWQKMKLSSMRHTVVHSQKPCWSCDKPLCHSRWEWCHLLFISWGSCGRATPLRFYILETSVPGGGVQQRVLLCSVTLSQMQDLGFVPVARLSCEAIEQSNTSRDHGTMTSGGVKWKSGDASILTHPWRHSLWWEQARLQRRLDQDLGEVGKSR